MAGEERTKTNEVPTDDEPDPITTSDGAVRQLEKAAVVANRAPGSAAQTDSDTQEVISLGKDPGGAPEEDAADASELSNQD